MDEKFRRVDLWQRRMQVVISSAAGIRLVGLPLGVFAATGQIEPWSFVSCGFLNLRPWQSEDPHLIPLARIIFVER